MGCSSSVATASNSEQTKLKIQTDEDHAENCRCLDVTRTEDVRRRSSVVTLKSGNIKVDQKTLDTSELNRKNNTLAPLNVSTISNGTKPRVVDSPAPFRKIGNGLMANSPRRMRIRSENPFPSPHAQRTTSPLVEQEEGSDEENEINKLSRKPKSDVFRQSRLDKALLEFSASLSETHGSILQNESKQKKETLQPGLEMSNQNQGVANNTKCDKCGVAVIDIGSGFCKAGFADEDMPSVVIPTLIGKPNSNGATHEISANATFVGNGGKLRADQLLLSRPVQRGVVKNWDDWTSIIDRVLNMELKVDSDKLSTVLPGSLLGDRLEREKQVEIMFEKLKVEKLYLGCRAPMALHAFGMTSGLLVNVGHEITSCVPVLNGNVQQKGVKTLNIGGSDISKHLQSLIQSQLETNKLYNKDDSIGRVDESIGRVMMERFCYVAPFGGEKQQKAEVEKKNYILPNRADITLQGERIMAPEILFHPGILRGEHESYQGIHELCVESVTACQQATDVTSTLYKNIVLSGGASLLPGLGQRLEKEVFDHVSPSTSSEVKVHSLPNRQYAVWRGAAHMTSLQLTRSRWMKKSDYDEHGPSIIHRKYL